MSIEKGNLVWVNGPYPCGKFPDVAIFRLRLKKLLSQGKKILANKGYPDERCLKSHEVPAEYKSLHEEIRARHASVNRRFKQFSILTATFRHSLDLHGYVFHVIANLTHVAIQLGENLFEKSWNKWISLFFSIYISLISLYSSRTIHFSGSHGIAFHAQSSMPQRRNRRNSPCGQSHP